MNFLSHALFFARNSATRFGVVLSGALIDNPNPTEKDAVDLVKKVISTLMWIPALLGAFFLFQGLWKYVQAFRDGGNPEGAAQAGREIIAGIGLIIIKIIANPILTAVLG